jgi:hypothetical protein
MIDTDVYQPSTSEFILLLKTWSFGPGQRYLALPSYGLKRR